MGVVGTEDTSSQYQLLPPLSEEQYRALRSDIAENGVLVPVEYDEDGNILDGFHRVRACRELGLDDWPSITRWGLTEQEKRTHARRVNMNRRHLNREQKREQIRAQLKDTPKWSNNRIAQVLGVDDKTVKAVRDEMTTTSEIPKLDSLVGADGKERPAEMPSRDKGEELGTQTAIAGLYAKHHAERERKAQAVKELQEQAPNLMQRVRAGELGLCEAKRVLKKQKQERARPRPSPAGKSPILLVGTAESINLPAGYVDLIITSPPYNLGVGDWPMGGDGREPRENGIGYDDSMPEALYQAWQIRVFEELYRVAKDGASFFYNHKVRNHNGEAIHPMEWVGDPRNPWVLRQEIIWDRGSTHNHSPSLFWPHDERVYWMTKGQPMLPGRSIGMPTVWRFHGPVAGTWHPAPFAEELPRKCIEAVGRDGIVVLDPFAGSCTTLRVALDYGYDAVGVDVSREYLNRAAGENGWKRASET